MRFPCYIALAAMPAFVVTSLASAAVTQIPVVNPSFESPAMSACTWGSVATGWTGGLVWHCGVEDQCFFDSFPTGPTDGLQIGFSNGINSPIVQTLAETLVANETYTLRVDIGMRNDFWHVEEYAVRLLAGTTLLAEDPGLLYPAPGQWETSIVQFTVPPNHPAIGQPLAIQLVLIEGIQADFDNVSLTKGESPAGILGDINNDGTVDAADLGLLLGGWGACSNCAACAADLNGDCNVDASDLAIVLGNWSA
ncbi:MAG: hypothetical protein JNM94_06710 [Phycisphaerae bacterium]|nr:hypothetical protein [Phycisphaerae bacterium]